MSTLMLETHQRAVRVYSCHIDGMPFSRAFFHHDGVSAAQNGRDLNRLFHAWLELHVPGAFAAGRVRGIHFEDSYEPEE